MNAVPGRWVRVAIGLLALIGLMGVLPVSLAQLVSSSECPHLGPVPACHLVSMAYATMLITVLNQRFWRVWYFLSGWIPVFILAATGSAIELFENGTCPRTGSGTPMCFLSLGLAVTMAVPVTIHLWQAVRKDR